MSQGADNSSKDNAPIIGIDLGTTNSCAAVVKNGKPMVLPSREGYNTVPSIVALNQRGKLIIGHPAKAQMVSNPQNTVYGAKRLVGRPYQSPIVQQIRDRFHYKVVEGPGGEAAVQLGPDVHTLQQISAMILKEVKELAQNHLGQEVTRAVITCPAYYNDNQRQAVREAGALAGLKVERILNEPTAAALAFGWGRNLSQKVLVYDLGGGTFDASLLELHGNVYEVLATGGDTFLGGVDFDNQIVDHLMLEFQLKTGKPFQGDRVALQRIAAAAEQAKCQLSEQTQVRVHVPFITLIGDQPFDLDVTLTRDQLLELTSGLVERTITSCREVLATRNLTPADVDEVLLVGGQSRMPFVRQRIKEFFGKEPNKAVHPDEAVAMGAAILAHSLHLAEGVTLIDVLPMSIGLALPGGRFKPVIPHNTPLPATKKYKLVTTRDNQADFELVVYQGDADLVAENEYLGTVKLSGLPKGPKGSVELAVSFNVASESTFTVSAKELKTGKQITANFETRKASKTAEAVNLDTGPIVITNPGMPAAKPATQPGMPAAKPATSPGMAAARPSTGSGMAAARPTSGPGMGAVKPSTNPSMQAARPATKPAPTLTPQPMKAATPQPQPEVRVEMGKDAPPKSLWARFLDLFRKQPPAP